MSRSLNGFKESIQRAREMCEFSQIVKAQTTSAVDLSDMLRSALVLGVSALDQYVHSLVREGMLAVVDGRIAPTKAFEKFKVPMASLLAVTMGASLRDLLISEIRTQHGFLTFQRPDKIADAIRLFSDISLWREVSQTMSLSVEAAKGQLDLIVDRRNQIAHEADVDPTSPNARWPIQYRDVVDALQFVDVLAAAIDAKVGSFH